jgi:5-methylcytosine-specific restriction endonuclease McrA
MLTAEERRRWAVARRLAVEQAAVLARHSPRVASMRQRVSPAAGRLFRALYDGGRQAVDAMKRRLPREALPHCQYCGLNEPTTLDHFVEKHLVPELAVCARNLVPCCPDCNLRRGRTFDGSGLQRVLHFYDDDIEALPRLLEAQVSMTGAVPAVRYQVRDSPLEVGRKYQTHFRTLELGARYRRKGEHQLPVLRARFRGLPQARSRQLLLDETRALDEALGPNNWRSALYRASADASDVLHWLTA